MYKKIEQKDIDYLLSIFDDKHILIGNEISEEFGKDELGTIKSMPEVLVFPTTTVQISKVMKYANEMMIPVVVRGSGTGLVGSSVALFNGIMLDTSKMNKILDLDEDNLSLTVEPGVLLMDIYNYVEEKGYFYAPDPGEKTATIGGNISTNAGGMRAVKYGVTRDWVRTLEVVLANGEVVNLGRNVVKDSTGYSLKNLIIGSEGTLGIITKATLKLIHLPTEVISLLVPFDKAKDALDAVIEINKSPVKPTAIEFFERNVINFSEQFLGKLFPDKNSDAYLLLTFDASSKAELNANYEFIANLCLDKLKAKDVLIVDTEERKDAVWKARGAFLEAIKASTTLMDECDVVVPIKYVSKFIDYTSYVSKENNIRIPFFGHAGDGNLHIYICKDEMKDEEFKNILNKVFKQLYSYALELGGLISGEHGIGFAKKEYMIDFFKEEQINLMKGIKKAFDPNNILNPGKIF